MPWQYSSRSSYNFSSIFWWQLIFLRGADGGTNRDYKSQACGCHKVCCCATLLLEFPTYVPSFVSICVTRFVSMCVPSFVWMYVPSFVQRRSSRLNWGSLRIGTPRQGANWDSTSGSHLPMSWTGGLLKESPNTLSKHYMINNWKYLPNYCPLLIYYGSNLLSIKRQSHQKAMVVKSQYLLFLSSLNKCLFVLLFSFPE